MVGLGSMSVFGLVVAFAVSPVPVSGILCSGNSLGLTSVFLDLISAFLFVDSMPVVTLCLLWLGLAFDLGCTSVFCLVVVLR